MGHLRRPTIIVSLVRFGSKGTFRPFRFYRADHLGVGYGGDLRYPRGPQSMTAAPIRHSDAPAMSQRSGRMFSIAQSQKSDATM